MVRGAFAGLTSYENQSFVDIITDLGNWLQEIKSVNNELRNIINELKKENYWNKVYFNFKNCEISVIKFFETSINEITGIIKELHQEVRADHINRIESLAKTASKYNHRLGDIWHKESEFNKEYDNPLFNSVDKLYCESRDMVVDMLDLSNLAMRLNDFVGKNNKKSSLFFLKPNFCGFGIDLIEIWHYILKSKK